MNNRLQNIICGGKYGVGTTKLKVQRFTNEINNYPESDSPLSSTIEIHYVRLPLFLYANANGIIIYRYRRH